MSQERREVATGLVGAVAAYDLLADMTHPVAWDLERLILEDSEQAREDALRHIKTITGGNVPDLGVDEIVNLVRQSDLLLWEEPIVGAPFLVLKVDWQNDGTDVGYYSEADIANSKYQLHGRVLSVGAFTRAFGVDHSVQRSTIDIRLEDIDRTFATRVRNDDADYLSARFTLLVGSPHLLPHQYVTIATGYRVMDVQEITETEVAFSLIDGVEDLAGLSIVPPVLSDMAHFADISLRKALTGRTSWGSKSPATRNKPTTTSTSDTEPGLIQQPDGMSLSTTNTTAALTVPFGEAFYRAPFAAVYVPGGADDDYQFLRNGQSGKNPLAVIVLGASKHPVWMVPHYYGDCKDAQAHGTIESEPIIYSGASRTTPFLSPAPGALAGDGFVPDGTYGIRAYIDVQTVTARADGDNPTPWYVATLLLTFDGDSSVTVPASLKAMAKRLRSHLRTLKVNIQDVFIDINRWGAASEWTKIVAGEPAPKRLDYKQGPIGVLEYVVRYHTGRGLDALRGTGRIIDDYEDAQTYQSPSVGGVISSETSGEDVIASAFSTFGIDLGVGARGRLLVRPVGTTLNDKYLRIPTAKTFTDAEHILEGSWRELSPKGSERWGWGTVFKWDGIQEQIENTPGFRPYDSFKLDNNDYGQEVEKRVNISWRPQVPGEAAVKRSDWVLPYTERRHLASFQVPISHALNVELGDFCYVTHYAAANADGSKGWDRRICRVDAVTLDWEARTAELTVVDWLTDYEKKPWVLDDQRFWVVSAPVQIGSDSATMAATSDVVQFAGGIFPQDSWVGMEFRISRAYNPWPYPANGYQTYLPTEDQCGAWTITAVDEGLRQITLDAVYGTNLTVYAWRVLRTHTDPPSGVNYPNGDEIYGRLCDEEATASDGSIGAFSNGDTAYRVY